jgi:hypothetical protein
MAKKDEANIGLGEGEVAVGATFVHGSLGHDVAKKTIRNLLGKASEEIKAQVRKQASRIVNTIGEKYGVDVSQIKSVLTGERSALEAIKAKLGDKANQFITELKGQLSDLKQQGINKYNELQTQAENTEIQ